VTADWLDDLSVELARHVRVLRHLVAEVSKDPRFRALQVQGSVGRGEADRYSDLDLAMVVEESAWPSIADAMPALVRRLGEVVDDHLEFSPGPDDPDVLRVWAQFSVGIQLDMLVLPTSHVLGSGPDGRTLMDPDGILMQSDHPMRLTDRAMVGKWAFLCWHSLAETTKNVERGKFVAAAECLASARLATISCWAAAHGVDYAGFANVAARKLGVSCPWPDGLEKTYPAPERDSLLVAALALCELQSKVEVLLEQRLGVPPRPLGRWVTRELESLQGGHRPRDSRAAPRSRPDIGSRAEHPSARPRAERRPR
jgi:predicted nucleotidyltransferase